MAGLGDGDRVGAVGGGHRAGGARAADGGGEGGVAARLAGGDVTQRCPDLFLERRAERRERGLEPGVATGEVGVEFARDPVMRRPACKAERAFGGLPEPGKLAGQRLALGKLQQVQMRVVRHRDHRPERCRHPIGSEQRVFVEAPGCGAHQPGEGGAEGGQAVEPGIDLGVDHPLAGRQRRAARCQPQRPGDGEKRVAGRALEGAAHRRRIVSGAREVGLAPAAGGVFGERGHQRGDERVVAHRVAAFAGAQTGLETGGGAVVEAAGLAFRLGGRAVQAAEDAGAGDADEGAAMPVGTARQERGVERGVIGQIEQHGTSLADSPKAAAGNRASRSAALAKAAQGAQAARDLAKAISRVRAASRLASSTVSATRT